MKILLACAKPGDQLAEALRLHPDYVVAEANADEDIDDVYWAAQTEEPQVIVLFCSSVVTWYEWAVAHLRNKKLTCGIVALIPDYGSDSWASELLDVGADAVLGHPVNIKLLHATLRAVTRRCNNRASDVIEFFGFKFDIAAQKLTHGAAVLHLASSPRRLLQLLLENRGKVVTRETMMQALYPNEAERDDPDPKIIDVFLCKIRNEFRRACGQMIIQTSWGRGYLIEKEDAVRRDALADVQVALRA